ncbi:MAG: TlpA disulfide reductase family protein [Bacteroidales bacterium]|nr:TlpA disulfide reductase family protein [Bacteroidales bacterium]
MNKTKNKVIILSNKPYLKAFKYGLFVLFLTISFNSVAYNIKIEIENCPKSLIYLGKHKGPDFEVIDSVVANNELVIFNSNKTLEKGVYFIIIPPQTRFDFIIAENQDFTIKTDNRDILNKLEITGEKQYQIFIELQKKIAAINKQRTQLEMELNFFEMYQKDTLSHVKSKIDSLNNAQLKLYSSYKVGLSPNDFLYKILNILEPFNPPDSINKLQYSNPPIHYKYYINHYLDRIDFTEAALLNTPAFVFHKQLEDYCYYFFDIRVNKLNEVYPDIDSLIAKTNNNPKYEQYILSYLISRYEKPTDLRLEGILVYVYRNYFMINKPNWVTQQAYDIMKLRIESIQYNLIGSIGKNLILTDFQGNKSSIYSLNSNYKVLFFWEPDCDICTDALLELNSVYDQLAANDIEVIAINTNNKKKKEWLEFISTHELNWINAFDKDNTTQHATYYGTYKTPRIFVLDKHNKIITKDIKPNYLYNYIMTYENQITTERGMFDFMFGE